MTDKDPVVELLEKLIASVEALTAEVRASRPPVVVYPQPQYPYPENPHISPRARWTQFWNVTP